MRARLVSPLFPVALAVLLAGSLVAQATQAPVLPVHSIWGTREFASDLVSPTWTKDGAAYTTIETDSAGHTDLYRVDAVSGRKERLVRGADLVPPGAALPVAIEEYRFSSDGTRLLIFTNSARVWRQSTKGTYYVWDLPARRLIPVSAQPGYQMFAKLSPDGRMVAFVRDNNLYVTDLATGAETALTTDGGENVINGTSDWVYEEGLDLRDAFRWSPDGRRIAFWRFDQTAIPTFYLLDADSLYPQLVPMRYPKAGMPNSEVKIGVVDVGTRQTTWVDLGGDKDIYVAAMDFAGSSNEIWLTRLNRHQDRLDLLLADAQRGASRVIMTDRDSAWVDANQPRWINGGKQFLFVSERDGYDQVYLFNRDGSLLRRVTPGGWDVLQVYGVDEKKQVLYCGGAIDGPLGRPLVRIGLDGKGLAAKVTALGLVRPEFITLKTPDGVELNAWIIKPKGFDPSRRYPLLMNVYGGPGSQTVTDSWGGANYLWHQMLARDGYLVASVDNRGTGGRGARFMKLTYLHLGRYESADQIASARWFAAQPYVDPDRIGIWGWSYGGYMSSLSMFRGAGVFKAGLAVAPVTDWRFYDTIYTERYMRTPQENPAGYAEGAPLAYADSLKGHILLVHGTGDDNVHFQNSVRLVERLEAANRQFDMRIYPNKTHAIAGGNTRENLYGLFTAWLEKNL